MSIVNKFDVDLYKLLTTIQNGESSPNWMQNCWCNELEKCYMDIISTLMQYLQNEGVCALQ